MLHPVLGSLLELVHVDTVESFARRLRSRGRSTPIHVSQSPSLMTDEPMTGSASSLQSLGGKQNSNPAPDILEHDNEGEARIDARVLPTTRERAGLRQRTFAETVATLSETCWEHWPITRPRTFVWCARYILTHYTGPEARYSRWLVETKLDLSVSGVSEHSGIMRIMGLRLCNEQLEGAELPCMELLAREAQMIEPKYKDRVLPKPTKDTDPFPGQQPIPSGRQRPVAR